MIPYTLKIRSGCEEGGKGALIQEDKSATLATNNDQYLFQPMETYQKVTGPLMANSHPGSYTGQDAYNDMLIAGKKEQPPQYIVRRLTPTECARLQGFPDKWGHPDPKEQLTPDEYRFWHKVRNTHEVVNGKEPNVYNVKQMTAWYNKLHTDSSEYKMWGNGIALPCALYVMQGIAEAEEEPDEI